MLSEETCCVLYLRNRRAYVRGFVYVSRWDLVSLILSVTERWPDDFGRSIF